MSLFASTLVSLVFFSGFAVAGLYAPGCSSTWAWVRTLSFPHSTLALNRPGVFALRRSILSGKIRVQLQRTCCRRAMEAVSCYSFVLSLVRAGRDPYHSVIVFSLFQHSPSKRCSRDTIIPARRRLRAATCACAIPSHIRS